MAMEPVDLAELRRRLQEGDPFTENALARRFSLRHAQDLRYVAMWRRWLRWDGARWCGETTLLAFDLVRESCQRDGEDSQTETRPRRLYSAKTVIAVERLARADRRPATTVDQWDAHEFLLNADNATLDLRTGSGREPDPNDYLTKKTACAAAPPGTPHPLWDAFLKRIAPDPELRAFLKRFCGYCLTGVTTEHKFVFAWGTGANGKSVLVNTVAAILGDYATIADVGTFIASNSDRHPTDVAKLRGYRLAVAQETQKGRRWDEGKIKSMTGGDKLTARFMRHCDFFDFAPQFKLWIIGNHKPHLDNIDEAMRRRMLLIPFTVQIPPEERDPDLFEKLKAEWPAILRWMIDWLSRMAREAACRRPQIVTDATDQYFNDQDVIGEWLEDCTEDGWPLRLHRSRAAVRLMEGVVRPPQSQSPATARHSPRPSLTAASSESECIRASEDFQSLVIRAPSQDCG